jgi:polyhydroxyalkanoate synthesis regulator phasin
MNLIAKRWLVAASTVLLSGALATGAAFAAPGKETQSTTAPTARMHRYGSSPGARKGPDLDQMVKDGKITQGEADVLTELHALRKRQMGQLHADAKALIAKAVAEGKITQAQADKLWQNRGRRTRS